MSQLLNSQQQQSGVSRVDPSDLRIPNAQPNRTGNNVTNGFGALYSDRSVDWQSQPQPQQQSFMSNPGSTTSFVPQIMYSDLFQNGQQQQRPQQQQQPVNGYGHTANGRPASYSNPLLTPQHLNNAVSELTGFNNSVPGNASNLSDLIAMTGNQQQTLGNTPVAQATTPLPTTPPSSGASDIGTAPSRTVYLGNVPSFISAHELLNHVRSGIVESLRIIPAKNCAFISFLDENSAMLFHSDAILKRLTINGHEIKIGWGNSTPVQPVVASCVARYRATRNVYLGNLPEQANETELASDLAEYGEIEAVKVLPEKRIAFVHYTSIISAIRCVQALPLVPKYRERKVFYGKDRCAFITKTQQHNAAQYLGLNPNSDNLLNQVDREMIANALVQQSNAAAMIATAAGGASNLGNRTIYLGNLHPDTTIEEICNVVRGGILQNVRPIPERHVCFVTFVDPISAAQFYAMSSLHGVIIHNRKIKVGWGKHSGPLPNSLSLAVGNGASRNIYIGGLDKIPEIAFTREKLYRDFKEFGEIEQINFFEERHCCFVNFTNISNSIKAIDGIRNNPDYQRCKINFGKDRCGNVPRQFQLNGHHNPSHSSTNSTHSLSSGGSIQSRSTPPPAAPPSQEASRYTLCSPDQPPPLRPVQQQPQFGSVTPSSSISESSDLQSPRNNDDNGEGDSGFVNDGSSTYTPLGIMMGGDQIA